MDRLRLARHGRGHLEREFNWLDAMASHLIGTPGGDACLEGANGWPRLKGEPVPACSTARDEQKQLTRERIYLSARAAFRDNGFHGLSTDKIAKAAGVSYGSIFTHFESKGRLIFEIAGDLIEANVARLAERGVQGDTPRKRAAQMFRELWRWDTADL